MKATKTRSTIVNSTLILGRLECALGTISWELAVHWAVGTLRTSLRNHAIIVAVFAWLTHSAFTELFGSCCICESTNRANYRWLRTLWAVVAKWTWVSFILDIWSVSVGLGETNVAWRTVVNDTGRLAELGLLASFAVLVRGDTILVRSHVEAASTGFSKGIVIRFSGHTDFELRAFFLNTSFTCEAWWTAITSWLTNSTLNESIWAGQRLRSSFGAIFLNRADTTHSSLFKSRRRCWRFLWTEIPWLAEHSEETTCAVFARRAAFTWVSLLSRLVGCRGAELISCLTSTTDVANWTSTWNLSRRIVNSYIRARSAITCQADEASMTVVRWCWLTDCVTILLCVTSFTVTDSILASQRSVGADRTGCRKDVWPWTVVTNFAINWCCHLEIWAIFTCGTCQAGSLSRLGVVCTWCTRYLDGGAGGTIEAYRARVATIDWDWCRSLRCGTLEADVAIIAVAVVLDEHLSVVSCVPCLQLSQSPRPVSRLETFEDGVVWHVEKFAPAASLALDAVVVGAGTSPSGPVAICAGCGLVGAFGTEHGLGTEVGIWCCLPVYTVVVVAL